MLEWLDKYRGNIIIISNADLLNINLNVFKYLSTRDLRQSFQIFYFKIWRSKQFKANLLSYMRIVSSLLNLSEENIKFIDQF